MLIFHHFLVHKAWRKYRSWEGTCLQALTLDPWPSTYLSWRLLSRSWSVRICRICWGHLKSPECLEGVGFVWSVALSLCFNIDVLVLKNLPPLKFNSEKWWLKMNYIVWTVKFPGCNFVFQHWFFVLNIFGSYFFSDDLKAYPTLEPELEKPGVWWCPFF